MRFFLLMAVFGIAAIVFETTWFARFPADSLRLDLITISVAAISFYFEPRQAMFVIVFLGFLVDATSSVPFGISVFSYLVIYGLVRTVITKILFHGGMALLFWVALVSLLDKILCSLVFLIVRGDVTVPRIIMQRALPQAVFDAIVAVILIPFLKWYWDFSWEKITRPKGLVMK